MSNVLISEVYRRRVGSIARTAVMALFADKADDDGTGIWASKQRMADELGTSKQTILATIKSLIADGLVAEAGQRKSPNGYTVEYTINIEALHGLETINSQRVEGSKDLTGQAASPVKQLDVTSQAALPDQSSSLTQTLLNPPKPYKHTARAHVIPENWAPREFGAKSKCRAIVSGWSADEHDHQVEHFTKHHRGKGNRFVDWQDAWETWVLKGRQFTNHRSAASPSAEDHTDQWVRRAAGGRKSTANPSLLFDPDDTPAAPRLRTASG